MAQLINRRGVLLLAGSLAAGAQDAGVPQPRIERAAQVLEREVADRKLGAAAILVTRHSRVLLERGFGRLSAKPDAPPVRPDSVFLVASLTKPVTASALMLLVQQGRVSLAAPVRQYLPEFAGGGRERVLVRHILSHTSGLPDMLPENAALRAAHAPLDRFLAAACKTPLLFAPGTNFRYQSMGFLLAGAIVERVAGVPLRDFEKRHLFEPLEMRDSSLGLGGRRIGDLVQIMPGPGSDPVQEKSFGPNTPYWRDLGTPWGGLHTTTRDYANLLQCFLNRGEWNGRRLFSPAVAKVMTTDQNQALGAPWGIGWALRGSKVWNAFGDAASPGTFGHAGASGTVAWAAPRTGLVCVILTNRPFATDDGRLLRTVSNAVAES